MTKGQRIRARKGVAAYNPEFLLALKKAATEGITIPVGPKNIATSMRHRLYSLRSAMERENHPDYQLVATVVLSLFNDTEKGWCIIGSPGDEDLAQILRQSGAAIPEAPSLED
jgi:hypothetical protein